MLLDSLALAVESIVGRALESALRSPSPRNLLSQWLAEGRRGRACCSETQHCRFCWVVVEWGVVVFEDRSAKGCVRFAGV